MHGILGFYYYDLGVVWLGLLLKLIYNVNDPGFYEIVVIVLI